MYIFLSQERSPGVFRCTANSSNEKTQRVYFNRKYRWIIWLIRIHCEWNSVDHFSNSLNLDSWDFKSNESFFKKDSPGQKSRLRFAERNAQSLFGFTKRNTPLRLFHKVESHIIITWFMMMQPSATTIKIVTYFSLARVSSETHNLQRFFRPGG